jgi:prefoldin subunit 5
MSNQPENLVLEHLRAIRADLSALRADVREIKLRQNDMTRQIAALRRDQAGDAESAAHVEARLDRFGERLERIERRLDIQEEA